VSLSVKGEASTKLLMPMGRDVIAGPPIGPNG
jgi:hypothetical protein